MIHQPSAIIYEDLIASYASNLAVQTRGFSAGDSWLESWVPDDDILSSLINLVEAAQIGGIDSLSLNLKSETLSATVPGELCLHLGHLASVTMAVHDDGIELVFTDLQKAAIFSDVRENYRHALRRRHGAEMFAVPPPEGAISLESEAGRFWFVCNKKEGAVNAAGFEPKAASPSLSAAMDCLCGLMRGLPLPEIREHAIIRLEYLLREKSKNAPVPGIVLPQNADPLFAQARSLLDALLGKAEAPLVKGINFHDAQPTREWIRMETAEREQACQNVADAHSAGLLGYEQGIRVVDAHKPYAVTVKFEGAAPVAQKRRAALELEKIFRAKCDSRLEVFCLEMKDASQLRRL